MSSWVDLMNSLIIDHYINLILTFTGVGQNESHCCRIMTCWWRSQNCFLLIISNIESWHNITSAKREAIINVFFLLFLEFCTSEIPKSQYSNMWWYVQLYISCQYRLRWFLDSASDNLFAHTQKLCTPYFFFPLLLPAEQTPYSYTWDQENLDDDGFSHTLSTTPWVLNWKIPVVLLLQICRILGAAKSHQIELKEKSASYFPYHVFNFSCFHTHIGTFVPFSDH